MLPRTLSTLLNRTINIQQPGNPEFVRRGGLFSTNAKELLTAGRVETANAKMQKPMNINPMN